MKCYAGCGSPDTPEKILKLIRLVAGVLSDRGITLRATELTKADEAFWRGSKGKFFTYLTAPDYAGTSVWGVPPIFSLSDVRSTLARRLNAGFIAMTELQKGQELAALQVMLGYSVDDKAKLLVTYAPDHATGFVKRCLELAELYEIPVFNLAKKEDRAKVLGWLK